MLVSAPRDHPAAGWQVTRRQRLARLAAWAIFTVLVALLAPGVIGAPTAVASESRATTAAPTTLSRYGYDGLPQLCSRMQASSTVTLPAHVAMSRSTAVRVGPIPAVATGVAAKAADDWPDLSGIVRDAAKGKGNFGLGSGTASQAQRAGQSWVGDGFSVASDGKTLVSANGLRQWRPPSYKPNVGIWQSNFESRLLPRGQWQGNGHLDITDLP